MAGPGRKNPVTWLRALRALRGVAALSAEPVSRLLATSVSDDLRRPTGAARRPRGPRAPLVGAHAQRGAAPRSAARPRPEARAQARRPVDEDQVDGDTGRDLSGQAPPERHVHDRVRGERGEPHCRALSTVFVL
ncbi:hypothetical protein [Streptomyces carminius]|uniref:hypothetical protein n=1 Tax=Streptomyces carminius TaxID=2665496 RepID=UPI0018EBD999|nr:hypothetical protein [Streptomyces carminius]